MAVNPDEDTEFNDALRKHGVLPPKPEAPRSPSPPPSPSLSEELDDLTLDELKTRGEDENDSDIERDIAHMQRERFEEMVREDRDARFGRVYPISREDYTREVTEASKEQENDDAFEGEGTGVVCFLYKSSHPASERAFDFIRTLAERYPQTKFVSIVGDKCIPNYPDRNSPTLILYRNGQIVDNLVAWGANEKEPGTIHHLETVLLSLRIICLSRSAIREAAAAVRAAAAFAARHEEVEEDNEDSDDLQDGRARRKNGVKKTVKQTDADSDSDFDL